MTKAKSKIFFIFEIGAISIVSVLIIVSLALAACTYYFSDKILPNISISGINVGYKTPAQAEALLNQNLDIPPSITLLTNKVPADKDPLELSLSSIGFSYDISASVWSAFGIYREKSIFENIPRQIFSFVTETRRDPVMHIDEKKLDEYLEVTASSIAKTPEYPAATFANGSVSVTAGKPGDEIDTPKLKETILHNLQNHNFAPVALSFGEVNPALTSDELAQFQQRAEKLVGKTITLSYEFTSYKLRDQKLLNLLEPRETLSLGKAEEFIAKDITPLFNRPAQNAAFKLENGKVQEFKPAKEGITINEEKLFQELRTKFAELESSDTKEVALVVPVQTAAPTVTTQEVNQLGINELIGRGTSVFKGSITSRIFNIGHASSQLNGVLVPPNTVFSFVNVVGDVSKLTGYKEAYIIQNGRTVLGDGGGLCQVSTTLFRAVMNAGLPILERRAHAYRVGYYEQDSGPGLDATVYVPTTDFKFKNDTPNTILIQTVFDAKTMTLAFELYGTKDGRVATVTKPQILNQIAPPEDLYIDDPTLPTGKVNQVEHKAWGAKVSFDYTVTRDGKEIYKKTFVSNYQPWKAVFMRGTGPV